jgi:hypothetical protein
MTAVFVVGALAVVGAVVARVTWRRPADERHSIQSHQQTLETLRSMADRRGPRQAITPPGTSPRPSRSKSGPAISPGRTAPAPPAPARSNLARSSQARSGAVRSAPRPGSPAPSNGGAPDLVFGDDAAGTANGRADGSLRITPMVPAKSRHRSARGGRLSFAPRRTIWATALPVVAVAAVLALVVALVVVFTPSHHTGASNKTTDRHATHHTTSPTQTSVTTPSQLKATTSTASTASYIAPAKAYTVTITASGLCWIEATATATGSVVWTGTLQSGQSKAIAATGNLRLRLGAANDVAVTLNGKPVVMPAGFASPFDMTFSA